MYIKVVSRAVHVHSCFNITRFSLNTKNSYTSKNYNSTKCDSFLYYNTSRHNFQQLLIHQLIRHKDSSKLFLIFVTYLGVKNRTFLHALKAEILRLKLCTKFGPQNVVWLFDGRLIYTSASLRAAIKRPSKLKKT